MHVYKKKKGDASSIRVIDMEKGFDDLSSIPTVFSFIRFVLMHKKKKKKI